MRVSVQLAAMFERLALLNAVMHHALHALRRACERRLSYHFCVSARCALSFARARLPVLLLRALGTAGSLPPHGTLI